DLSGNSSAASLRAAQTARNNSPAYAGSFEFSDPIAPRRADPVISTAFSNNTQSESRATAEPPRLNQPGSRRHDHPGPRERATSVPLRPREPPGRCAGGGAPGPRPGG